MIDGILQFDDMRRRAETAVRAAFPIEANEHVLAVSNLRWLNTGDEVRDNIVAQKEAKLKMKTFAAKLIGDVTIKTKAGKTVDAKKDFVLLILPHITARASYIVDGNEVQTVNQLRLRPGPYTRYTIDNNTETFINAAGGGYRIIFNRETGVFRLKSGQTSVYLYPVLKAMGVSDQQMQQSWGPDLLGVNKKYDKAESPVKLFRNMRRYAATIRDPATMPAEELAANIQGFFESKKLEPSISKITMGEPYDRVTIPLLLKASQKALALSRNEVEEDDTESLAFKSVFSVEDFIEEKLKNTSVFLKRVLPRIIDRTPSISMIMSPMTMSGPVLDWFKRSEFTRYSDQLNPIDMAATAQLTTLMGEGGIQSEFAVSDRVRDVHPSSMGFIDPSHTPEGQRIGVTGHFTIGVSKKGNRVYIALVDAGTGKIVDKSPDEIEHYTVAFPDQYVIEAGKKPRPLTQEVKVRAGGKIQIVPASKVQYVYQDSRGFFSAASNAIPFIHTNHATRSMMADRHLEQAVPLLEPEAPLVQSQFTKDKGYEQAFGENSNVQSSVSGTVTRVDKEYITIRDTSGKAHKIALHYRYPLNGGVFLTDTPIVKSGDVVKKGQILANNNFSKDKALALGKNLIMAVIPWKGWNFEDGYVVSETAARKLTSEHMHDIMLEKSSEIVIGLNRWLAHFPGKADNVDRAKYDDDGVIKKGVTVEASEVLIPAVEQLHPHEEYDYARLHKAFAAPWRDASEIWDGEVKAEVVEVVKTPKFVRVQLRTEEPLTIGDKLSMRSGGKGVVALIMPENEMPRTSDGKPVEVMYNPASIAGRTIPGLLFEGAAAKIAAKDGKPYLVHNFDISEAVDEHLTSELKKRGLSDAEDLYDPVGNRTLKDIFVGPLHVMKLQHQVRKKFFAKGFGSYTVDALPTKVDQESAQNIGVQEIYALLASGALHFLQDSTTLKGSSNPEYWRALQSGLPTPPPQQPFILDKFTTYLAGAGINLKQDGGRFKALPVTDKDVLKWARGEIESPGVIRASDLTPEPGGLFDKAITGGIGGTAWSMITLESPVPNPLMEKAIISLAGLKATEFKGVMNGTLFVTKDGKIVADATKGTSHGEGLKILLAKIDVERNLSEIIPRIRTARGSMLDALNKKRRYLQALKAMKMSPMEAYLQSRVPVIPPAFRPIYPLPNGSLNVADVNHMYREILLVNNQIKDLKKLGVDDGNLARMRSDLYGALQGVVGLTEPLTRGADFKGFIAQIKGKENKSGMFQGRMVRRPQDLSGRSAVVPVPHLGMDTVGLPIEMGLTIYKPFIVRRLVNMGHSPTEAGDLISKNDPAALRALKDEMEARPVYMNRAPTLHQFNMLAFKPIPVEGRAIHVNPLIVKGYNMDFDGDQNYIHVIANLSEAAILSVKKMKGDSFIEDRRMASRLNLTIPVVTSGDVFLFHLEDFPAGAKIKTTEGAKGPIEWYETIPGTKVVALNERTGAPVWADVSMWSKHIDRIVETVDLESGRQLFVDDDPRAVYGLESDSFLFTRHTPSDAVRTKMWVPRLAAVLEAPGGTTWLPVSDGVGRLKLNDTFDLNADLGYLFGSVSGDGWCVHTHDVCHAVAMAYGDGGESVVDRCDEIISRMFKTAPPERSVRSGGEYGKSHTVTWTSVDLAAFIEKHVGHGAKNKHLPAFFLSAPLEFRRGLFAGLMDTDGSISISNAKKKPQLMANISSVSLRLLQEARLLAASLEIDSRITPCKTPAGLPCWTLNLSGPDIKRWGGVKMTHTKKVRNLDAMRLVNVSRPSPRADIVPITKALARHLRGCISSPRNASRQQKTLYANVNEAQYRLSLTRSVALNVINTIDQAKISAHPDGDFWVALVRNTRVKWDRVLCFTKTDTRETGFDLTVPGYETFMSADGVILSNTVGMHVPVSEEARREAFEKLPSRQLFATSSSRVVHAPSAEASLGLYVMTAPQGAPVMAKSIDEMLSRFQKKEIEIGAAVNIGGKIWTPGQALLNAVFPADSKPGNVVYDNATVTRLLYDMSRKHPKTAGDIISKIKDLGNHYVTHVGFSFSLKDLMINRKTRDKIMQEAAIKAKTVGFDSAYAEASQKINDLVKSHTESRIVLGNITSGAFGKAGMVSQMLGAPVAVVDHKGRSVHVPIERSYAEGLDIGAYWATLPGARHGMIQKGLGTQKTGALAKRLLNTTSATVISEHDCGTTNGLAMLVEARDALDRVVASGPHKGKLLTPDLVRMLVGKRVSSLTMRAPLTCQSVRGVCVKCFGLLENGQFPPVGYHIGVLAGQAVSEPVTQLMLRQFHTQGIVGQAVMGFDRVAQLYEMPDNVRGSAVLAKVSGKISDVKTSAAGGWFVSVDSTEHYIPPEVGLGVKKGDVVRAGKRISLHGVIKPQELLGATGDIHKVREQIINDLTDAYRGGGLNVRRKLFETVVKPMTDRAEVADAGDGEKHGIFKGDVVSINQVDAINKEIKKSHGKPIRYEATLLPIRVAPFHGDDFIGKLMFERPHETLATAPSIGATADAKTGHPITQHVFGRYVIKEKH